MVPLPRCQYQSYWMSGLTISPGAEHAPLLRCVSFFLQLCVALLHLPVEHLFPAASGVCLCLAYRSCLFLALASLSLHHVVIHHALTESRNTSASAASLCAAPLHRRLPLPTTFAVLVQPLFVVLLRWRCQHPSPAAFCVVLPPLPTDAPRLLLVA